MDILIISFLITVMLLVFYFVLVRVEKERKTKSRIDLTYSDESTKKRSN